MPADAHSRLSDRPGTFDGWPRAARGAGPPGTRHTSTFPGTMLSSVFARLALLYTSAAAGSYTCPGSSAYIHASARVTALANATCDAVREEMLARVHGQPTAWHDPHNNGTYAVYSQSTDKVTFTRLTGNHKYTDKLTFVFQESDGASCLLHGCSESQVTSIADFGTNYCNLRMLYCGSGDSCKPLEHDFTSKEKSVSTSSPAAQHELKLCLKV